MPDLSFHGRRRRAPAICRVPAAVVQAADRRSGAGTGSRDLSIQTVALRCQIRIEPTRSRYVPPSKTAARPLRRTPALGPDAREHALDPYRASIVPAFTGSTLVDLPVPCTFDFNVAATKYFHAPGGRRGPALPALQRDDLLHGRRTERCRSARSLGEGNQLSAPGAGLEGA